VNALNYSYLSASTGFVLAVFSDCQVIVAKAMAKAIKMARLTTWMIDWTLFLRIYLKAVMR